MMTRALFLVALTVLASCQELPVAEESFSDALVTALRELHGDEEQLAATIRQVERAAYTQMDLSSSSVADRAVGPTPLTEADVADLPRPATDPGQAMGVAMGVISNFDLQTHKGIPLMTDQRPVEPQSPDHYEREFLEGEDCWFDQGCSVLKTRQQVTKKNALLEVPYEFFKDFRWVDLSRGLDADGPRWAYIAKSWNPDSFSGVQGQNVLVQSYTVEFWIPRDGGGFAWEDETEVLPLGEPVDSEGAGVLRLLSLWTETELSLPAGEELVMGTIRFGIQQNFDATEDFLREQADQ
jgi:hypothetical protein